MKTTPLHRLAIGVFVALAVGCATAPEPKAPAAPPAKKAPAPKPATPPPAKPVVAAPQAVPAPNAAPATAEPVKVAPVKISPEAEAVVERLTHAFEPGSTAHEIVDNTGFSAALSSLQPGAKAPVIEPSDDIPQPPPRGLTADGNTTALVDHDWTGIVLVPINTSFSKAHTSAVKLTKVEAHPLNDGRARVWTRVRNTSDKSLPAEIACTFKTRTGGEPPGARFYEFVVPAGAYRDVFFVSPAGDLVSYTVLIRSSNN